VIATHGQQTVLHTLQAEIHSYVYKCTGLCKYCNVELNNQPQYYINSEYGQLVILTHGQRTCYYTASGNFTATSTNAQG